MSTNPVGFGKSILHFIEHNKLLCIGTLGFAIVGFVVKELGGRLISWIKTPQDTTLKVDEISHSVLNKEILQTENNISNKVPELKIQKTQQIEAKAQEIAESKESNLQKLRQFKDLLANLTKDEEIEIVQNRVLEVVEKMVNSGVKNDIDALYIWLNLMQQARNSLYDRLVGSVHATIAIIPVMSAQQKKIQDIFYKDTDSVQKKIDDINTLETEFQKLHGIDRDQTAFIKKKFEEHSRFVQEQIETLKIQVTSKPSQGPVE